MALSHDNGRAISRRFGSIGAGYALHLFLAFDGGPVSVMLYMRRERRLP